MKLRKLVLAASMALAAVAAMAPMAQAQITYKTQSVTTMDVLHYEGNFKFTAGVGTSLECPVTAELYVSNAGVPSVQSFAPATTSCVGTGPFTGCRIKSHSFHPPAPSTVVHVNTTTPDLRVTDFTIRWEYKPESCLVPIPSTHLIFPEITLSPHKIDPLDEHHSIDALTINGTAGSVEGTPGGPIASGILSITPSQAGEYTLST